MKKLVKMLNDRAEKLGMTPDVAFAYKSFVMNIADYSERATHLKLRFWVLYRTNQTVKYNPEDSFIPFSSERLFCDLEGIVCDLEKNLREQGSTSTDDLNFAIYGNLSNRIHRFHAADFLTTEWAVDCCMYDAFITDPSCNPMLMVNVRPYGFKILSYAIAPFHAMHDPFRNANSLIKTQNSNRIFSETGELLERYSDRARDYNSDVITNGLVDIIKRYFHVPENTFANVMPVDLATVLAQDCNMMLDTQYVCVINNDAKIRVYLSERDAMEQSDIPAKISIKNDINNANSIIARSK